MRKIIFMMLLSLLLVIATACGTETDGTEDDLTSNGGDASAENVEDVEEVEEPEVEVATEDEPEAQAETEDVEADTNEESSDADKITETGVYNGQADSHTIEIETTDGPAAFQLSMEAKEMIDQLNPGENVTYTYYKDGEQNIIASIEAK